MVKLMGHGSCILGHGLVFVWVSGSWVTACDPSPALLTSSQSEYTVSYTLWQPMGWEAQLADDRGK